MPKMILTAILLALIAMPLVAADVPSLSGTLKPETAAQLGSSGARVFRTAAQWTSFQDRLTALGWEKPADNALSKVDFARDMIVCVFENGDEGNTLNIRKATSDGKIADIDLAMSYIIYKQHGEPVEKWRFMALSVPQAPQVKVSVASYHPANGGPYPTIDKARPEWSATLGEAAGDLVGGLQGNIEAKNATVKAREDIQIQFTLQFLNAVTDNDARFAKSSSSASIWDGKYSNGYRNHAFLVTTPDGKSQILRPKPILNWDKNAPHLVEISAGKPYILPAWVEGQNFKSLKELGLDTSAPGVYQITGVYMETASIDSDGNKRLSWGGELFTNSLRVEVK